MERVYFVKLFLLVFLVLVALFIQRSFFARIRYPEKMWQASLIYAFQLPLKVFICLFAALNALQILSEPFPSIQSFVFSSFQGGYKLGWLLLSLWVCLRFFSHFEKKFHGSFRGKQDPSTVAAFLRIVKIVIVSVSGLAVLQSIGLPFSGLLAFGGMGSIALGFAGKDLLSNLFGRLMIFLDQQFEVGDWIRSPDREIEGFVEHIGWRLTRVKTLDKRPLFIPNSVFSTIVLENPSRMSHRRMKTIFRFEYEEHLKIGSLLKEIEDLLKNHPYVDTKLKYFAHLVNMGLYGLEVEVQACITITETVPFQKIQQEIFLNILSLVENQNVKIASANQNIRLLS